MAKVKLKLLYLLDIFYKKTDTAHRLTSEKLCGELLNGYGIKVERKAIYRDIATLREYGADIIDSGTGYYLRMRRFSPSEIRLLAAALQAAVFIPTEQTANLIERLCAFLSESQANEVIGAGNLCVSKCANGEVFNTIDSVNRAIYSQKMLTFYYYKRDASKNLRMQHNEQRYCVSPYAMIWAQDRYYLVANMDGRDDLTHFRLDRIRGACVETVPWRHFREVSDYKIAFDAADYAAKCINMFGGDVRRVTLRCDESLINEVLDRFGENTPLRSTGDGAYTTSVETVAGEGFMAWVAQFFGRIQIIAPTDVLNGFKAQLAKMNEVYNG